MFKSVLTLLLLVIVSFAIDKTDHYQNLLLSNEISVGEFRDLITCENKFPRTTLEYYHDWQTTQSSKPDTIFSVVQIEGEYYIVKKYEKSDTLRVKVQSK